MSGREVIQERMGYMLILFFCTYIFTFHWASQIVWLALLWKKQGTGNRQGSYCHEA
jgi:hypothetical protein